MSDTTTLGALTEALIWEAGIDGKTGSNARHVTARLYELVNRQYKQLRSIVTAQGEEFFRRPGQVLPLPGREDGVDYIAVPYPTDASEIISVDVQSGGTYWQELTPASRRQWRVYAGAGGRPQSPGEWSVVSMPQGPYDPEATEAGPDGQIAIWPPSLSGNYAIDIVPHWVSLTNEAATLILFPHWEEWLLCSCVMVISQRDNNKRNMFVDARDRKAEAQAQIIAHARRSKRGSVVARRRDGVEL